MKYLLCLMVLALILCLTTSAMAVYVENYEMDNDVTTDAGTTNHNVMALNGAVGTGMTYSGGVGTFLDNTSSGNYGVSLTGAPALALVGTGGYTVDMRVKWDGAATAGNSSRKTLGFSSNQSNGRGIRIESWGIWLVSSGEGASAGIDLANWQDLRVIVSDYSLSIYDLTAENGWYGDANHLLVQETWTTPNNNTGVPGADGTHPKLSLGNYAGGSTSYAGVQYEYVRIAQGTDPLANHLPEPGSMLALGSGLIAMAGLALRRRRA